MNSRNSILDSTLQSNNQNKIKVDLDQLVKKESIDNRSNIRTTWVRNIKVVLTSKINGEQIVFKSGNPELNISIQGTKNLALNKDKGTVTITNIPYDLIISIVSGQFYNIEIYAGYGKDTEPERYFKGEVSYISQKINTRRDVDTYITYASSYVANFSQQRISFNLNSGINIYAAIEYMARESNINKIRISPSLKKYFTNRVNNLDGQAGNLIEQIASQSDQTFYLSTDESDDDFYIDCTTLNDKRRIEIDPNMIILTKGNPTISEVGLKATFLPLINFKPGDIIIFPNYLIDASISDANSVVTTFNANFFSPTGQYMIRELSYNFQNRGTIFELNITAIALEILTGITGGVI